MVGVDRSVGLFVVILKRRKMRPLAQLRLAHLYPTAAAHF